MINTLIHFSKSKHCNIKNNNLISNNNIDLIINSITNKLNSDILINKLILESYEKLYTDVIVEINIILENFQTKTILEVLELYNNNTFLSLITKVASIKNNILAQIGDFVKLPKHADIFINYYIEHVFTILHSFSYMLNYISDYDSTIKCCEVLQSLENIQEYVKTNFRSEGKGTTITAIAVSDFSLTLKEPYNTYVARYGLPGESGFITSLLAEISLELGL